MPIVISLLLVCDFGKEVAALFFCFPKKKRGGLIILLISCSKFLHQSKHWGVNFCILDQGTLDFFGKL